MNKSSFAIRADELAVAQARRGNAEAMEHLYRTYSGAVYSTALRICASVADAEDITQDTFIEVFRKLHQYRGDAPFWAWLRRIAVNNTLMRLRHEKTTKQSVDEENGYGSGQQYTDHPANLHDMERVLDSLSATARAVVWLHDIEGYTHSEIGELMGKTSSFSKSQLSRAYEKLRSKLTWQTN
jgi:RNA polymerase sigma factor (sigma-70 family)